MWIRENNGGKYPRLLSALSLRSPSLYLMICSNRKTRVFDLSGHETFIAYVSLIHGTTCASCFRKPRPSLQTDSIVVLQGSNRNFSYGTLLKNLILLSVHLPILLQLSNDDHSYFVRWKLPTEILEVFDDNKWLRLSSPTIHHLAVFSMDSQP